MVQVFKTGLRTYDARKAVSRATSTTEAFSIAKNRELVAGIKQQEIKRDLQLLAKETVKNHIKKKINKKLTFLKTFSFLP